MTHKPQRNSPERKEMLFKRRMRQLTRRRRFIPVPKKSEPMRVR